MASAECRILCRVASLCALGALVATTSLAAPPAGATSQSQIAATEAQVGQLESTIAAEQRQSAALDAEYLAAQAKVAQLQGEIAATKQQMAAAQDRVRIDKANLNHDAVNAYVNDMPANSADSLFADSPNRAEAEHQYEQTVVGNITYAVVVLNLEEDKLATATRLEQSEEQQAASELDQLHALQAQNQQAAATAQATLSQVKGSLATEVAQYAEQQAQAEAAYAAANPRNAASAAASATQDASVAVALGGASAAPAAAAANQASTAAGGPTASGTSAGSGSGAAAVAAAESQLGVPYVWGGESPGHGFDCSGLTQWAWATAGVSIPRVASAQAAALPRVSLNALEPGDLLFYYNLDGDNTIDHVVMYVGSGPYGTQTIIQAPYTGATVQYAPLFTDGLVGAGRP